MVCSVLSLVLKGRVSSEYNDVEDLEISFEDSVNNDEVVAVIRDDEDGFRDDDALDVAVSADVLRLAFVANAEDSFNVAVDGEIISIVETFSVDNVEGDIFVLDTV